MDPVFVPALHGALTAEYGSNCHRNCNDLSACLRKLSGSVSSLVFLLKCRQYRVFPKFISKSIRFCQLGRHMERLAHKIPRRLLSAAIRDIRARTSWLEKEADSIWNSLFRMVIDAHLWNALVQQKDWQYYSSLMSSTSRLQKKFVRLFRGEVPNDPYCDALLPSIGTSSQTIADYFPKRSGSNLERERLLSCSDSDRSCRWGTPASTVSAWEERSLVWRTPASTVSALQERTTPTVWYTPSQGDADSCLDWQSELVENASDSDPSITNSWPDDSFGISNLDVAFVSLPLPDLNDSPPNDRDSAVDSLTGLVLAVNWPLEDSDVSRPVSDNMRTRSLTRTDTMELRSGRRLLPSEQVPPSTHSPLG